MKGTVGGAEAHPEREALCGVLVLSIVLMRLCAVGGQGSAAKTAEEALAVVLPAAGGAFLYIRGFFFSVLVIVVALSVEIFVAAVTELLPALAVMRGAALGTYHDIVVGVEALFANRAFVAYIVHLYLLI